MATRWGIVATGRISSDFTLCLTNLPKEEHVVAAVSARSINSAQKFAEKYKIPKAYGDFRELAKDPNVDVVYVGNLNNDHYETVKAMFDGGKHVLCEKPLTMNLAHTEELIKIARKQKLFFMEAIWTRFFPAYDKLRQELADKTIGEPSFIQASFGVNLTGNDRVTKLNMGGSAVLDIGVYVIQLATMVYNGEVPAKIIANGYLNDEGVDEVAVMTLMYSNGRIANLNISGRNQLFNEAVISGPDKFIRIPELLWCPTKIVTPSGTHEYELPKLNAKPNWGNSEGLTYEAIHVRQCLKKGLTESPLMPLDQSRTIAFIEEEVRKQLGSKRL